MLVAILILCRFICVVSCFLMAMCHLAFGPDEEASGTLLLYAPFTTVVVFFILMGLHLTQLIKMCCCKGKITPVHEIKASNTIIGRLQRFYYTYLGNDGLFGRRGKYYNWRLVIREVVEIPAQTYQGYLMSTRVPFTIFPTIYGCTIALDCILVPLILLSSRLSLMARRNGLILLDIVVDIILGAILPFSVLVPSIWMYVQDPNTKYDQVFAVTTISACRQMMITSPLDLVISALPLLFSHMMINSVHNNWLDAQMQKSVPKDAAVLKTSRIFRTLGSIWSAI